MSVGVIVPIFRSAPTKQQPRPITYKARLLVTSLGNNRYYFEVAGHGTKAWINSKQKALCFDDKNAPFLTNAVAAAGMQTVNRLMMIADAQRQESVRAGIQSEEAGDDRNHSDGVAGQRDWSEQEDPMEAAGGEATQDASDVEQCDGDGEEHMGDAGR